MKVSWIAECSGLKSGIPFLKKISYKNDFQPVGIWPDQSASFEEKEALAMGRFELEHKQEAATLSW